MSKIHAKIGAGAVALTAGAVALTAGLVATRASASASACDDFATIYNYYVSIGDNQTAWALWLNMIDSGCFSE